MIGSSLGVLLRQLTGRVEGSPLASFSDGQLLERFVFGQDEAAFAGLLCRHGPMVLSVCRRALSNEQDREDVFQATFLLLARKAGSIRKRESVGSWLHGVAQRLAVQCRRQEMRRRAHEKQAGLERTSAAASEAWEELRALLDEAIAELPEKYRSALVLCYLEDHSHQEAARRLGCRLTTLRSRVARGRERLRAALVRRGLALSSAAFVAALAASVAQAALPASLRIRTLTAALQSAKGDAVATFVSASTAALVEGGLSAMSAVKLKYLLILVLAAGLTLGGAGLLVHQFFGAKISEEAPQPSGEQIAASPPDNKPKPGVDRFGDPLPERAVARLGTVRFRMAGLICACAWSPDGKTLAAGSANFTGDNTLTLFDAATGKPIRQLRNHQLHISSLAYSPDGRTLASGGPAGIVLWDSATAKTLRQFSSHVGELHRVRSLAFTSDGKALISAGEDKRVHLWDTATGKEVRQFTRHPNDVHCAALSPDGQTLASAAGKDIWLWETATGKMFRCLTGQKEPIRVLIFSPDGKWLASGSDDRSTSSIHVWETATGKVYRRLPEDAADVRKRRKIPGLRTIAFSPDGKTLAAGYGDYGLYLWDVAKRQIIREMAGSGSFTFRGYHDGGIQCVAFSGDGKRLVLARDNQLALLDAASGKEIAARQAHRGSLHRVFFSPDGKRLITTNSEPSQRIVEWDAASGRMIRQVPGKASFALASFSPDRKIMASSWGNATLTLWDTSTGKEIRKIPLPLKVFETPGDIVFSPDGKRIAVEEANGKAIWLYDPETGKQVCTVEEMGGIGIVYSAGLAFSADGRVLAMAGGTKVHVAEVPSGRQLLRIDLPKNRDATAIALSPDGRIVAAPSHAVFGKQSITLWESASGKERLVLPGPHSQTCKVAFSPDGRLLAAAGWDNIVFIWDTTTGKQVARLEGHQGSIESLAFSPDSRRLASGSQDTTALIWDVSGLVKEFPRRGPLSRKELDELWSTLAAADAAKAYQAILTLQSVPAQTVPLLAERLHPKPADDKRITRLLNQLDSDSFAERERATKELRELSWTVEPALHKVLENKPSLEVRQRVKALLGDIRKHPLPPELLRILRSMEVLEHIGTPAARKVIAALADGTSQARLTREANAALQRWR